MGMNHFTPQIDARLRSGGVLDLPFVRTLMKQSWDSARGRVDDALTAQLYAALVANFDRVTPDARELTVGFLRAHEADNGLPASTAVHALAPDLYRQCSACYGSGRTTCSSCGGMGGRYESRVTYDYDYNPVYSDEWIGCFCSGGYTTCGTCGGSGSVAR
jgi:hypothetical protein